MRLADALFNWLQIRVVMDLRKNDRSASDTEAFFQQILREDHKIDQLQVQIEEGRYLVTYTIDNEQHEMTFDREAVDVLLTAIQNEPKYAD
ncbi:MULTISPECIES: hypothetical protein [Brevibacillus]|uniref:Uncharacterized protein n=2 Tax=Brevibacillus laterosporus TaxID=1465 RepID=A0AAP3GD87_BRELA|nr:MULTISPECIES: hypothetical protein [Brevibacillus]ATO48172.1 hypothetical protein BrL25_03035 [Brevibacillus laterosporus DSM 25]AYB37052.1 hypothetical protein D5F52_01500 [Brevibacillus laterosporus]MBG9772513.1 hypothetical protein [Brevibacillus laterosporus]MBG9801836.1 hypothetical protein [Brevibacillus laterosporus]MBM7108768.1 hypothetical protein [Brevibacillus laterosporus]